MAEFVAVVSDVSNVSDVSVVSDVSLVFTAFGNRSEADTSAPTSTVRSQRVLIPKVIQGDSQVAFPS